MEEFRSCDDVIVSQIEAVEYGVRKFSRRHYRFDRDAVDIQLRQHLEWIKMNKNTCIVCGFVLILFALDYNDFSI